MLAAPEPAAETDAAAAIPVAEAPAEPPSEADLDVAARLEAADPSIANTVRREQQENPPDEPVDHISEECERHLHDDEDLLEALAPEVAEAIRVEHRLFNGRRSIPELIEAHRDDPAESREKRSWWKRGKR